MTVAYLGAVELAKRRFYRKTPDGKPTALPAT
jgi:hypothetical protein